MALLPQDPKKQQILLIGLVPLLIFVGWYYFLRPGKVIEIETLETQVADLESKNITTQGRINQLGGQGIQAQVELVQEHIRMLEGLIPESEEVSGLIHRVTELTNEAGLNFVGISPVSIPAEEPGYYSKQLYDVEVSGGYHQIGYLLSRIGSMERIITPIELQLARSTEEAPEGEAIVTAEFKIQTYVLPPPQAVAEPQGGTGDAP
ncbi:MAG: type 4a pilus biogenesis protein PilO [Gemmatimonadota bacterium]